MSILIKQLIIQSLAETDEALINKKTSFHATYQTINLASNYSKNPIKNKKNKNQLYYKYKKSLTEHDPETHNKLIQQIRNITDEDRAIIQQTITEITDNPSEALLTQAWNKESIGVLSHTEDD